MKRLYPPNGRQLFDGGLNTKFQRSIIEDNESPDCLNVVFTNGAVETRQGTVKVNTASVGSFVFDGLYTRRANTNAETMCAFAGGHMFTLNSTSFVTVPSAQSVWTAGVRVAASQFQNYMFMGNGGVIPYKWNGTEFTRHGVYPPTTTCTVASSASGSLSGDYLYRVTAVNSNLVESDMGPVHSTFTAASATILISAIPTFSVSYGVNARRLYRTVASGAAYKLVTTLSNNSATTFTDTVADSALGAAAPLDNGAPPNFNAIIYHQNRLFMNDPSNPNYVWYTDISAGAASAFTVPSTNFFIAGDGSTDLVKGFGVYDNGVMVYCEKSVWFNYMTDATPSNWKQVRVRSPHGSKSPFCILDYLGKQLYPAVQNEKFVGIGSLRGEATELTQTNLNVFTAGSEIKSERVEPDMFNVQEAYLGNISGIVFKNKAYLTLPYGTSQTTNNRIYIYDFSFGDLSKRQEGSWVPWTGLNAQQFTIYSGNLYFCTSDTSGFVYKMEAGTYSDDGAAIDSYFWTKEYSGAKAEYNFHKDFRYANILLENVGAYYMDIGYRVNSDSGSGQMDQVSVDPGGSVWGTMRWGLALWGGGSTQKEIRKFLGSAAGKRIQLKFSNQNKANQRFKVSGMNFLYNLKGYR